MIQENEIVQCPECEADLLRVNRPVLSGDLFTVEMFDQLPLPGVELPWLRNGMFPQCPICTARWAAQSLWSETLIHTKIRGWV